MNKTSIAISPKTQDTEIETNGGGRENGGRKFGPTNKTIG